MPFYKHVNPGDTVTHSAGRENAISQALGQLHAISAPRTARPAGVTSRKIDDYTGFFKVIDASEYDSETESVVARVRIVNGSSETPDADHIAGSISAYGTVYQIQAQTVDIEGNAAAKTYLYMRIYDATSSAPAEFISSASKIEDDGLNNLVMLAEVEAGMSSISQITKTETALAMGNSYTGDYAAIPAGHGVYQIKGGITDIGDVAPITFDLSAVKYFMLIGVVDGDGYRVEIATTPPSDTNYYGKFNLANVFDGQIFQQWTGGAINFRDYYLL